MNISYDSSSRFSCFGWAETLFPNYVDEPEEEEGGEDVEHPVFALGAAGEKLDQGVTGQTEAEAVGDGPCQRDGRDGEECWDGELGILPLDMRETRGHQRTDNY